MNLKEHCKKRDWVYYLVTFVGFMAAFMLCSLLIDNMSWIAALIAGVVSAVVFTLLTAVINHADDDIKAAVEEDKREGRVYRK